MMKKIFVLLLAALLCISMTGMASAADVWDGTVDTSWHNTTDTTFTIDTAEELAGLASIVNTGTDNFSGDTITLAADINLKDRSWTPIGSSTRKFNGTFDGGGYTISNLKIDSNQKYVGLFGYINNSTIRNVVLESPEVATSSTSTTAKVGALVGNADGSGNIEYCAVRNGSVSAPNSPCDGNNSGLGGLVGCHNTSGNVIGCYNYMTTVSTQNNTMKRCGGVAGSATNTAMSCYTYNTNQCGIPVVGGKNSGTATVPWSKYSAYLKAEGATSSAISTSSYSVALSEEEFANGTAAYYLRTGAYSEFNTVLYPWGQDVEGSDKESMPVWNGTKVYRAQYVKDVNGAGTLATVYLNELDTEIIDGEEYRVIRDAYDWMLFAYLVNMNNGNAYPYKDWNAIVKPANAILNFSVLGTLGNLNGYHQKVVSIGTNNGPYNGTFNGNGCTITGLKYESGLNYGAFSLFGYVGADGHISNITVEDAELTSASNHYLSTFVRENKGTIENCHAVDVAISSKSIAGGIAYYNNGGTIEYCSFSGSVISTDESAGGIAGSAASGAQFLRCWNKGDISGSTSSSYYAGGILARDVYGATINNCYNTGDITAYYAGGIVGSRNGYGTVENCHSYNAKLTGTKTYPIANDSGISNSYYLADIETDSVNGTTFKTAEEFENGTVLGLLNDNNTETVWYPYGDYPILEAGKTPQHIHDWTYAATGDTLTAACGNEGCPSTNKVLKINAPVLTVYGGTESKEATLSATSIGDLATLPAIQYEQKDGESWTVLSSAPVIPGSYRASITVDTDKTASVGYTIDQATLIASGTGIASGTYGTKLSELNVSGLTATLNGTEVLGAWTLTGEDIPNVGDTGSYTATFMPVANAAYYKPLTEQVTLNIATAQHTAPTAVVGSYVPNADKTAFVYTISEPNGIAYEYSKNDTDWQNSPIFAGFNAGDKATFYARVKADPNHTASDSEHTDEVEFTKLDQAAPALSYQVSGNSGNRTITITEVDGAEYSFDGGNAWGSSNVLTGIHDETVSIAIRIKETAVYEASEKASASVNTAKQVQTVTFDTTDRTATYGDGTLEAREAFAEGAITYESSDETVATVDDKGVVTIVGAGTATITARAAETETHAAAQASYSLTVNPKPLTAEGITLTLTESLYQYDGTAKTPVVLLKDGNTVLEADKDYQVKDGSTTTASAIAVYTITLTGKGNYTSEISEEWEITRIAAPAAPQNLQGVAPTTGLVDDGKIIGTTDEMEYATKADFSDAKDCGEGETINLAPGTYYVRLKGTDTTEPGAAAVVNVPAYSAPVITFDANGGTVAIASVTTEQDGTLAELPTATRSGYTFDGWFTAKTGGTQVTADTFFSVSTTIYAQWNENPSINYTVTASASPSEGGTVAGGGNYTEGTSVTLTATANEGYQFACWTGLDGLTITSGDTITETVTFIMPARVVSVSAIYEDIPPVEPAKYTVTVTNGTGSGEYAEDEAVTITANAPETGKRFAGWQGLDGLTITSGNTATETVTFTMPTEDVDVAASYEDIPPALPAQYTVTVIDGTGSGEYAEGETVTITANAPAVGKQFAGWTSNDVTFVNANATTTSFTMPAKAVTVTANYIDVPVSVHYTVVYNANGGTGAMASQYFNYGETKALLTNVFTREGYTFKGWNTKADGTGTAYADGQVVTMYNAAILYAQWMPVEMPDIPDPTPTPTPDPVVTPLEITQQPADQMVAPGEKAQFSIEASGDAVTYQWYINRNDDRGWVKLQGATNAVHEIATADSVYDGFQYLCEVRDAHGNVVCSQIAVLYVAVQPEIPETGDSTNLMLLCAMLFISCAGCLLLVKNSKRAAN